MAGWSSKPLITWVICILNFNSGDQIETDILSEFDLDLATVNIPKYIAIEGPIGIGKTTLAKRLAASFNYETLLEDAEENPFLERFYQDRKSNALPTQLFFLFQRIRKLEALRQGDIFQEVRISDFLIDKDPLFARITLDDDEFRLYQTVYENMISDLPKTGPGYLPAGTHRNPL